MHSGDFYNKVLKVLIVGLWKCYTWVWCETHLRREFGKGGRFFLPMVCYSKGPSQPAVCDFVF